ncbi:MAG: nickel-responsive transcriptional regulator NikR [Candidatus Thermoplasmatota archaeon]|nr:nickel-responsive transcriptional regulator NikR [Candidatus Thermoplasmatota archaeon]
MERISRFGVSFDSELLGDFDRVLKEKGYGSRSEALMDLARRAILEHEIQGDPGLQVTGSLTMVYDHHIGELTQKLMNLQHDHSDMIVYTTHVHVDHHTCLEVIILRGAVRDVNGLSDRILSLKGVKQGRLVMARYQAKASERADPHRG